MTVIVFEDSPQHQIKIFYFDKSLWIILTPNVTILFIYVAIQLKIGFIIMYAIKGTNYFDRNFNNL